MVALVLMVMLPEEPSWERLQAIVHGFCSSECVFSGPECVCLLPYTVHVPGVIVAVVYSLTPCHCCSLLLDYCCLSTHTETLTCTHTFQPLQSLWMNCEPLLRWMLLVTVGTADVLVLPAWSDTHSHLALSSLAYILSLVFPKATCPTYPQCTPATQTRVN